MLVKIVLQKNVDNKEKDLKIFSPLLPTTLTRNKFICVIQKLPKTFF